MVTKTWLQKHGYKNKRRDLVTKRYREIWLQNRNHWLQNLHSCAHLPPIQLMRLKVNVIHIVNVAVLLGGWLICSTLPRFTSIRKGASAVVFLVTDDHEPPRELPHIVPNMTRSQRGHQWRKRGKDGLRVAVAMAIKP